jgi:hypothetical protein
MLLNVLIAKRVRDGRVVDCDQCPSCGSLDTTMQVDSGGDREYHR